MKILNTTIASLSVLLLVIFASCKKTAPSLLNMYNVKLTLEGQPFAIDENGEVEMNSKDSVTVNYTLESPDEDMYTVTLNKTGTNTLTKTAITDGGKRRVYSGSFKFFAKDLGAGTTSYRIFATNKEGVYLGDGYKKVTIHVVSDLKYYSNIKVYMADTTKNEPCYLSTTLDGPTLYSYNTGATNSAKIDFGFRCTITDNPREVKPFMYSLSANPLPFAPYDISSWTKRSTLFSAPISGSAATWISRFNTGLKIETEAKAANINLTSSAELKANNFVFFKTPEGKYGVIFVAGKYDDSQKRPYLWLSYKMPDY